MATSREKGALVGLFGWPRVAAQCSEWVPGGNDIVVDNFHDTGRIDGEPDGFLRRIVLANRDSWHSEE